LPSGKKEGTLDRRWLIKVNIHVSQIKRYEAGTAQPTLEVFIKFVLALSVSADMMLFDGEERGPDEDLHLQFEPVSKLTIS